MKCHLAFYLGCTAVAAVLLSGCGKSGAGKQVSPPVVTVSHPAQESVTANLDLTGTAAASQSVDLVARIPGYLQSVNFQDGTFVESNQLLFVIEPEPYEQQLKIAQAQLLQANSELVRQQELVKSNATSVANVEKWQSQHDQAQAQVELAKLNLGYTHVTAPFSGRMGRHLVDVGNMVGVSGDTKLATLDELVPIYVYFNLNERDALRIRDAMQKMGIQPGSNVGRAPVLIGLQNESGFPHQGTLDFVNTGVSTSTGTIELRAVLTNEDKALFPGVFARVRIPLGQPQPMPVVPAGAIGSDQEGDYVLVADANDVVARRAVMKGPTTELGCAISSGITTADRVIVNGFMNAVPGEKVTPQDKPLIAPDPTR
jgi:membrane fusion protein, multidrug efflux system